ncbi:hypothetical protein CDAR_524471 [Caerostris darwini]|uniref:Secreted protein n=1 Tax=Caerostris darwini TaxID=1538125 RepID=A0AAV4VWQ2_9ARAC|nr:hypothetical protein CDAR_524471 [Caerostris darwini]
MCDQSVRRCYFWASFLLSTLLLFLRCIFPSSNTFLELEALGCHHAKPSASPMLKKEIATTKNSFLFLLRRLLMHCIYLPLMFYPDRGLRLSCSQGASLNKNLLYEDTQDHFEKD